MHRRVTELLLKPFSVKTKTMTRNDSHKDNVMDVELKETPTSCCAVLKYQKHQQNLSLITPMNILVTFPDNGQLADWLHCCGL